MKITLQNDSDYKSLKRYFGRLYDLLKEEVESDRIAPLETFDGDADEFAGSYSRISHLIKPDMVINLYGYVDFWASRLCKLHQKRLQLPLNHNDIRGKNGLHTYWKFLTAYCQLTLKDVQKSYSRVDDLRKVRNRLVHEGGFTDENQDNNIEKIRGVRLAGSLIVIEDSFIWDTLEHAKNFLIGVAKARQNT